MRYFLLAAVLLIPVQSFGSIVYSYTSPLYAEASGPYTLQERLHFQFTVTDPLLNFADLLTPVSWNVDDGVQQYSSKDCGICRILRFYISTDPAGEITGWSIWLSLMQGTQLKQTNTFGSYTDCGGDCTDNASVVPGGLGRAYHNTAASTPHWSMVDPIAEPVSEPPTLALLLPVMAWLVWKGRRWELKRGQFYSRHL